MLGVSESFAAGWVYGFTRKTDLSMREAERLYPDVDVRAFLNGASDGIEGDRFRLDHERKLDEPCNDCGVRACRFVDGLCQLCKLGRDATAKAIGEFMA